MLHNNSSYCIYESMMAQKFYKPINAQQYSHILKLMDECCKYFNGLVIYIVNNVSVTF